MDVDGGEEHRRAGGVNESDKPPVVHVAHDVLDGIERAVDPWRVVHREHATGHDHDHQHDACERSEIPQVVQVFRRRIFVQLVVQKGENRQTVIDPPNDAV